MMKRLTVLLMFLLMSATCTVYADDWSLVKNVRRLEQVAPDYKDDKAIDKKFLEVLDLTEKTKKDDELYAEARKIAVIPTLGQSKYMDSFLYYMFVRSTTLQKTGTAEPDYWLGLLKSHDKTPHLLTAGLVHMKLLPKNSPDIRADAQFMVSWIKAQKPEMRVRAPEYSRNMFMAYKPRTDFADGDFPKAYKVSYYMSSVTPIDGFLEDETYVSLLAQIKSGNEDVLTEMAGIYRKMGVRKEASETLYQLAALRVNAKDLQQAKTLLDDAVKLDPENDVAVKERNRIKLELTYQSLTSPAPAPQETPVQASAPQEAPVQTAAPQETPVQATVQ